MINKLKDILNIFVVELSWLFLREGEDKQIIRAHFWLLTRLRDTRCL